MNYSHDEFSRLSEAIEDQGGTQLPDVCKPQTIHYTHPPYASNHVDKRVTTGCYNEARFVIPYDPEPGSKENVNVVTACACDDEIALWPRFEGVLDVGK